MKWILALVLCSFMPVCALAHFPPLTDLADTTADVTILGAARLNKTGYELASGDINGDGIYDLIIGSSGASPLGRQGAGEVEILWGGMPRDSIIDLNGYDIGISRIFCESSVAGLFMSLTCSDYNNDGFDDIVLGLPSKSPFINWDGKAYIVFGSSLFPDTLDLELSDYPITRIYSTPGSDGWLGMSSSSGELNGDSYSDIVISSPYYFSKSEIYLIFGRDSFPNNIHLGAAPPNMTRIIAPSILEATGQELACGDVNKDGMDDLIIGSPGNSPEYFHGKATLIYGMPEFPDTVYLSDESLNAVHFFPAPDPYNAAHLGAKVAVADINNDGEGDIIIAAPWACPLGCRTCGEVYVIYGSEDLPDSIRMDSMDISMSRLMGMEDWSGYGYNLFTSDLTGDGYQDIAIMNDNSQVSSKDQNEVIIVYGAWSMPDSIFLATDTTVSRFIGSHNNYNFGTALGSIDLGLDGVNDLIIGDYGSTAKGRYRAGKVYLFHGIADSTAIPSLSSPAFVLKQNYPNPFSSSTIIEYSLLNSAPVTLTVYNILGQRVARIIEPMQPEGPHSITWNGRNEKGKKVASGIYFYRLQAGAHFATKKMILLR